MPFHLSLMQEADCEEWAELDAAAMGPAPIAQAMEIDSQKKHGKSWKELIKGWMIEAFKKGGDPNGVWLKVVDEETGTMVAAGAWKWSLEPETPAEEVPEVVKDESAEGKGTQGDKRDQGEMFVPDIYAAMGREWTAVKDEFFPNQPYYNLQVCATHPDWTRRGAGGMLVKYGCDLADEKGLICTLTATPEGYGLYLKHGFEVVKETYFDVRPYGVDAIVHRRAMIRKAQAKQPESL